MKGMHKISRGRGFRGALDYAFDRDSTDAEPGRLLGGNMAGQNARELAAEFGRIRTLRPDIEKPVWHNALRLPVGEKLSDQNWVEIADDYMQRMGYTDAHPRAYILHNDEDGQHIHIIASRVSVEGKVYLGKNENLASTRHIQALEKAHSLTITKGPEYDPATGKIKMPESRPLTKGEVEMGIRTQNEPPRQKLQRLIDEAKAGHPTAVQFAKRLTDAGVTVQPNLASTGRLNGFSFQLDGVAFKGSQLGDQYKWQKLQKEIHYEQERDYERLERYRAGTIPRSIAATGANLDTADRYLSTALRTTGNIDHTAGNIADRAARRAVATYLKSTDLDRGKATTNPTQPGAKMKNETTDHHEYVTEPNEPLDKRQKYKSQILEKRYKAQIEETLARRLAYVKALDNKIIIGLQDINGSETGKLIDTGDRISASTGSDAEIEAMIALAKAKGWAGMVFNGPADFKKRASEMAVEAGIKVDGYKAKPKLAPSAIMDALSELTNEFETSVQSIPAPIIHSPEAPTTDPYLTACHSEIQRIQDEINATKSLLVKVKIQNVEDIRQQALDNAQDDPRFEQIINPVRHLYEKRQSAASILEYAKERHAERGWLSKAINAGKIAKLEYEAAEAKREHLLATKTAKAKVLASEYIRNRIVSAEYENQRHGELNNRLSVRESHLKDLLALENTLKNAEGKSEEILQKAQRFRVLNPAEQSILDLVKRQVVLQHQQERLRHELEQQERLKKLSEEQEDESEVDQPHFHNKPF